MGFVYIVVCQDEEHAAIAATRQYWHDEAKAEAYRKTVAPSRKPLVVAVRHPSIWLEQK